MKRYDEFQSPIGQAALEYYYKWMRSMKRTPPAAASFLKSRYYRTFVNFAEFAAKVCMPTPEKFIWLMREKDYPPIMWTQDDVYTMYLEFLDRRTSPMDQMKTSMKTLLNVADEYGVDISDVFTVIRPGQLIHMIRTRQLSPWLLLHSRKFKLYFRDTLSDEQKIIVQTLINVDYWSEQFEDAADDAKKIIEYTTELGI